MKTVVTYVYIVKMKIFQRVYALLFICMWQQCLGGLHAVFS